MELVLDEMIPYIHNAVYAERKAGSLQPFRFTENQLAFYEYDPVYRGASRCPAGICLDFLSDTSSVRLEYEWTDFQDNSKDICLDLWVNERFEASVKTATADSSKGCFSYEMFETDSTKSRLTLYLPHLLEIRLLSLQLSEGASIEEVAPRSGKLLCLGDSITQGANARQPSVTYPLLLARALGMNVLNQGVSGFTFDYRSLDRDLPYRPDLITVAYGTNDWRNTASIDEFRDNCLQYLTNLRSVYREAWITVLTPLWRADAEDIQSRVCAFNSMHESMAAICSQVDRIQVVDGRELVPHDRELFADRRLHPNEEGFRLMADRLLKAIAPMRGGSGE